MSPEPAPAVFDAGEADFDQRVLERSRELPVVVDFWAEWCGPCRQLTPVLERAVAERAGRVELAKVDVDANPRLQTAFGIQGIPAVKAFRDGRVAAEFTGALPPAEVARFFDGLVPSEADELAAGGDEQALRRALELEPGHPTARRELGRLLLARGDTCQAVEVLEGVAGDFVVEGLLARVELADDENLRPALEAWDAGDPGTALEGLQAALPGSGPKQPARPAGQGTADRQDAIRRVMVAIFTELGADHPLAREHRRRLSAALN